MMEHAAIVAGSAFVSFPAKLGRNTPDQEAHTQAKFQVLSDNPVHHHIYNEHKTIN